MTKWFLEFFLLMRVKEQASRTGEETWSFGLIGEVTERSWIIWVLKRMREAVEEKPKQWTELQAGIECLTQLLLLIDQLSSSEIDDPVLVEAADVLQQQLIYNGEVLDIALDSLRSYKEGKQSLAYLDSSIYLAYALLRMLEKWGKASGSETYVRKKITRKRKSRKGVGEEDGIPDVEEIEQEDEQVVHETIFTFEAFELKFANSEITHTLLKYLSRYKEFSTSENMRRVVSLLHRQVVKAKAEGLFFKVSTLDLFKTILADQKSFPREQPYKDLVNLINFILRQFFKALEADSFLAIEAFFPKNRGNWKNFSSWEPEKKSKREKKTIENTRYSPDVEVKKGYSWSDQLGIAIANLVEGGQKELVNWTQHILTAVIDQRTRIIEETDKKDKEDDAIELDDEEERAALQSKGPSAEALAKITDFLIPYLSDEHADAATKNPHLKLLFRLSKFFILDEDAEELEWYVPAGILMSDLKGTLNVITQFLETPFDLNGKKPSDLLGKKRRRRRRRSPSPISDADPSEEEPKRKKKTDKKKKEKEEYKSAQFIEDSDEEYGDMEAFLEKERAMRQKALDAAAVAGNRPVAMKPTGTKKRRRKGDETGKKGKKRKGDLSTEAAVDIDLTDGAPEQSDTSDVEVVDSQDKGITSPLGPSKAAPRPKPRPIAKARASSSRPAAETPLDLSSPRSPQPRDGSEPPERPVVGQRTKRLIISDDEDSG